MFNPSKIIFLLLLSFQTLFAQNATSTAKNLIVKANKYLVNDTALNNYFSIDSVAVKIFASPSSKKNNTPEISIPIDSIAKYNQYLKPSLANGLKGMRIAIDPGHVASNMEEAVMEKKFLKIKKESSPALKQDVSLFESQLTLATALLLKQQLEAQGAIVFLTRNTLGETAFGKTFKQWLKDDFKRTVDSVFAQNELDKKDYVFLTTKASGKDIFRKFFSNLDNKERARKINAFNPDITIIIHFNVDETNTGWKKPSNKNFNMVFVPGAFNAKELDRPADRVDFLRLLTHNNIEASILLSSILIKNFEKYLNIPSAQLSDADYLKKYCKPTAYQGVFCRNLALTRLVNSPIAYGETLYQDNIIELEKLANCEFTINEIPYSNRIKQVTDAYFNGILEYSNFSK